MDDTLVINEIFLSLQGESTFAGLPCVFIRLTGCNLRCSYCDSAYTFAEGQKMTLSDILARVAALAQDFPVSAPGGKLPIVEMTGGEPLLQPNALPLLKALGDAGYTVLLETNGAQDISVVDSRVRRIMDLKCPSSGESHRNRWENLSCLKGDDEVKFVIASVEDYTWAKEILATHDLARRCPILFSWAAPLTREQQDKSLKSFPARHTPIDRRQLAEKILSDALPVRFQLQLHKHIWPPDARGV